MTRRFSLATLTLLVLPWLLVFINPSWILTRPGNIDPWIYFGFFTNLPEYLPIFRETYYASRLAWIVPGALVHQLLPALAANYVLHVGVYYAALVAIYFTLRRTVGPRAALFVSMVIGCYSYFLRAMGWHYVDGAGIAYYAVALACLTAAIEARRRWPLLICAGAAFAAAFHTNVAWSTMLPALGYYYVVTTRAAAGGRVLVDWLYALAGAVLVTLLLGVVSVANGGLFWFFAPSVTHVLYLSGRAKAYETNPGAWLAAVRVLAVPILVFVAALAYRVASGARETTLGRLSCDHYVIACVLIVAPDLAGRALLQNPLYLSYVLPGMALAIGVLLRDPLDRFSSAQFTKIALVTLAALSLALLPAAGIPTVIAGWGDAATVLAASLVALAAAAIWLRRVPTLNAAMAFALCAGVVNATTVDSQLEFRDIRGRENSVRAIVAAADALRVLDPSVSARLWYNQDGPLGNIYLSIASTRLWGLRLVGTRFPSFWNPLSQQDAPVERGQHLVVLTSGTAALAQAETSLRARGLSPALVATRDVAAGDVRVALLLLRLDFDRQALAAHPLAVSAGAFLDGSTKRAARRVAVDTGRDVVEITTNHSTYDFQIVSRPIAVTPGRRHVVEFDLQIPKGGAGVHVVAAKTQALLGSNYWCQPMAAAMPQRLTFDAGRDDSDVYVALSNCGSPDPVVSEFSVRGLRIWPYR